MRRRGKRPDPRAAEEPEPALDPAPLDDPDADEEPTGFDAWRRSSVGEVGTAIARGLGAVFAPSENRPVVSAPIPGDPPDADQGFHVVLDPDDPSKSVAVFGPETQEAPGPGGPAPD